jgi:hypothetical protein
LEVFIKAFKAGAVIMKKNIIEFDISKNFEDTEIFIKEAKFPEMRGKKDKSAHG